MLVAPLGAEFPVAFGLDLADYARGLVNNDVDFRYFIFLSHYWKSSSFLTDGIRLYTTRLITAVTTNTRMPMTAAIL